MSNVPSRPILVLKDIQKKFGTITVLENINVTVNEGELVTFMGPSGCGKTTLLRIVGGFVTPDRGTVTLDGVVSNDKPPYERDTAMVFQSYALFPHLTVGENVGYGLSIRKVPRDEVRRKVSELLALVQLDGAEDKSIAQLSGGQQQRVALARAFSLKPKILLLDEPLSNLDATLRMTMREEIRRLQKQLGLTTILVTHDQYEAMSISDRLVVLHAGEVQQMGTPVEVYEHPTNRFVADFVGGINFLDGRVKDIDQASETYIVTTIIGDLRVSAQSRSVGVGAAVLLVIRPETIAFASGPAGSAGNVVRGVIDFAMYVGSRVEYIVRIGETRLSIFVTNPGRAVVHSGEVALVVPQDMHILPR